MDQGLVSGIAGHRGLAQFSLFWEGTGTYAVGFTSLRRLLYLALPTTPTTMNPALPFHSIFDQENPGIPSAGREHSSWEDIRGQIPHSKLSARVVWDVSPS